MPRTLGTARCLAARLTIIAVLAVVVSSVTYAVSFSSAGTDFANRRPLEGGRPGIAAAPGGGAESGAVRSAPQGGAVRTAPPQRSPGEGARLGEGGRPGEDGRHGEGGRPGSLTRGLRELAGNAGIIAAITLVVSGIQVWLRARRRAARQRLEPA